MNLRQDDKSFLLSIKGYEFPYSTEYYDANWLIVCVSCSDSFNEWSAEDSCLLSFELIELKKWIESILDSTNKEYLYFIESELAFKFDKNSNELSIAFNYRLHPFSSKNIQTPYVINFIMTEDKLKHIINNVGDLIFKYPVRKKE